MSQQNASACTPVQPVVHTLFWHAQPPQPLPPVVEATQPALPAAGQSDGQVLASPVSHLPLPHAGLETQSGAQFEAVSPDSQMPLPHTVSGAAHGLELWHELAALHWLSAMTPGDDIPLNVETQPWMQVLSQLHFAEQLSIPRQLASPAHFCQAEPHTSAMHEVYDK